MTSEQHQKLIQDMVEKLLGELSPRRLHASREMVNRFSLEMRRAVAGFIVDAEADGQYDEAMRRLQNLLPQGEIQFLQLSDFYTEMNLEPIPRVS